MFLFSPGTVTVMVSMYLAIVIFCKYAYVRCEVTDNKLCEISQKLNWTRGYKIIFLDLPGFSLYKGVYRDVLRTHSNI